MFMYRIVNYYRALKLMRDSQALKRTQKNIGIADTRSSH